jgi:hypothetical protein
MKYRYKIECLGGCITTIDTDDVIEFDMTKPGIELNDNNKNIWTLLNTRNVVRIERTLNKED